MDVINTLRRRHNGRHLPDDIFKCISLNENAWISIEISLKLVRKGSINNIPALVQIMAWRRPGDKPLSGPMMARLPTHICVTRPQCVNYESLGCSNVVHLPYKKSFFNFAAMSEWCVIGSNQTLCFVPFWYHLVVHKIICIIFIAVYKPTFMHILCVFKHTFRDILYCRETL